MISTNLYQFYCNTESQNVSVWNTEPPTVCPNNNTHTVDLSTMTIIGSISEQVVKIKEMDIPTQGNYAIDGFQLDINPGPNVISTIDVSYPYDVNIFSITLQLTAENKNDILTIEMAPDTIIGAITNIINTNDTIIPVSATVFDYIKIGYLIKLFDGTNTEENKKVLNYDKLNGTITLESGITNSYSPLTPTYVKMTVPRLNNYNIVTEGIHILGEKKIGSFFLPKNIISRIKYKNNTNQAKTLSFCVDHIY
jgi:hypothetical protein